jgi:hypothetical protein
MLPLRPICKPASDEHPVCAHSPAAPPAKKAFLMKPLRLVFIIAISIYFAGLVPSRHKAGILANCS